MTILYNGKPADIVFNHEAGGLRRALTGCNCLYLGVHKRFYRSVSPGCFLDLFNIPFRNHSHKLIILLFLVVVLSAGYVLGITEIKVLMSRILTKVCQNSYDL